MKRICMMLVALALIFGLAQCKKNTEQNIGENEDEKVFITLNVNQGNGSRLDVDPPHVVFQNEDRIYVASNGVYVGYLEYNGTNFEGEISNATEGQPLYFYLLGNVTPAETLTSGSTTSCSVVISDQTVNKPVIACNKSNENFGTTNTFTSTLRNKCALVKFNVTTSSIAATCITGFNNKVTVNFSDNTLTNSQESNGVITLPAGNGEKWAILLPQEAMEAGGQGSACSQDGVYMGTRGAVPAISNNDYLTAGIGVEILTSNNNDGDHDYVDLGLPSGLLWATCNVGAVVPEDYGDYFAWGETEPKTTYNWSTYQYANGSSWQDPRLTKYCNNSSYGYKGFTDNLTTLLPEDDAATANWGSGWCMPTYDNWVELYQNTTMTWTTRNGINGQLFTANSGNSIFLPAAGQRYENNLSCGGNICYYWSSSLSLDSLHGAGMLSFGSGNNGMYGGSRDSGLSVRPVRSTSQNGCFLINTITNPTQGGTVSGGGTYREGIECTLIASVNESYTFTSWTENGEVVSTDAVYSFIVSSNRTLVANFTYNGNPPVGAICGKFTINEDGDQVYFSQGNLQYIGSASTPYWKFADNQWEYFGTTTGQKNVDRDLFGWGTSGYHDVNDPYNVNYQPWSTSNSEVNSVYNRYGYGPSTNMTDQSLTGASSNYDWGVYNLISNGGNITNQWRTLTRSECDYVIMHRTTTSGIRCVKANVNDVNGMILLPDEWNVSTYILNSSGGSFSSNIISATQWATLENAGAVFLPAASSRYGISLGSVNSEGNYWLSTRNSGYPCFLSFGDNSFNTTIGYSFLGHSVRLVRDVEYP